LSVNFSSHVATTLKEVTGKFGRNHKTVNYEKFYGIIPRSEYHKRHFSLNFNMLKLQRSYWLKLSRDLI